MKVQSTTQYAALCAIVGIAAHIQEVSAAPTTVSMEFNPMMEKRAPGLMDLPACFGGSCKKPSNSEISQPLIEKGTILSDQGKTTSNVPQVAEGVKQESKLLSSGEALAMMHNHKFPGGIKGSAALH